MTLNLALNVIYETIVIKTSTERNNINNQISIVSSRNAIFLMFKVFVDITKYGK